MSKRSDDDFNPRVARPVELASPKAKSLVEATLHIEDSGHRELLRRFIGGFKLTHQTDYEYVAKTFQMAVLLALHCVPKADRAIELIIKALNGFVVAKEKYSRLELPEQIQAEFEVRFTDLLHSLQSVLSEQDYAEIIRILDAKTRAACQAADHETTR